MPLVHGGALLLLLSGASASFSSLCSSSTAHTMLDQLEGEILFDPDLNADPPEQPLCRWHIFPNRRLQGISFNTSLASFAGSDHVSFYAQPDAPDNQYVGRFDTTREISEYMVMTGTDQASIVLKADSPGTRLRIHYRCLVDDDMLFSLHISPLWLALWMGVWMLLISMCCASTCWIIRHRRGSGTLRGQVRLAPSPKTAPPPPPSLTAWTRRRRSTGLLPRSSWSWVATCKCTSKIQICS